MTLSVAQNAPRGKIEREPRKKRGENSKKTKILTMVLVYI